MAILLLILNGYIIIIIIIIIIIRLGADLIGGASCLEKWYNQAAASNWRTYYTPWDSIPWPESSWCTWLSNFLHNDDHFDMTKTVL